MYSFKIMESANVRLAQGNWVFIIQLVPALGNKCSGKPVQLKAALLSLFSPVKAVQLSCAWLGIVMMTDFFKLLTHLLMLFLALETVHFLFS